MGRFIDITGAPIASDFQEMPLDFMAKALDIQQKSKDAFDTARDSILPSEGGLASTNVELPDGKIISLAQYEKDKYDKSLEDIAKVAINNPTEGNRRFGILKKQRDSDPFLKWAKEDYALRPTVISAEKAEDKVGATVRAYRDKEGKVIPIKLDDIISGKYSTPSEYYDSIGWADYATPVRSRLKEGIEEKHISTKDIDPVITQLGGLENTILALKQGKITDSVDRMTLEDINDDIETATSDLLNGGSAWSQTFKAQHGIIDGRGNVLVDDATAYQIARKFVASEAENFIYNNSTTSINRSYTPLSDGSGKKKKDGEDDESGGGATLTPEGTIDTEYAKDRVELLKKTNHNTILQNAAKKLTSSRIDPINDDLFKNNPQFSTLYRKLLKPSGYVDPDKLMKADLNALIDAAGNNASVVQTLKDLQVAQVDYNTLKEVDDLADYNAKKRSGYTDTKYKALDAYKNILHKKGEYLIDGDYIINVMDDGTVVQQRTSLLGDPVGIPTLLENAIPKKDVALAQAYFKDVATNKKLQNYEKIKKEEADRLLPSVVNIQAKVETITFDKKADREIFDDMVMKAIVSAKGLGKGSHTFSNYGKADDIDLPENMDPNSIKTIGHYKNKDGYATVFTVDVPTGNGKMVKTFTLNKSTPGIVGVIDNLKGDYNIVLANVQRQVSENTIEAPPKGYSKPIRVNNKLVAIQSVDNNGNSNFTLEKDIIDSYNAKAKLSGKKEIKEGDSFTVDTLPIYIAIAEAPLKDAKGNILLR